ncbi:MAG: type II secretion system F family protein [Ornithinimicrobium sp.]
MSTPSGWLAVVGAVCCLGAVLLWPTRSGLGGRAVCTVLTTEPRCGASWPRHWVTSWRSRGKARLEVLPLLDGLSASLAAGLTPEESLRMASRTTTDTGVRAMVAPVLQAAQEGRPLGVSWQRVAREQSHADLASLARAWLISERLGCPLSDAVATTASTSRSRTTTEQRLSTATAGARATSALLSVLPVGGAGIALMLGIDPLTLYGNPLALASALCGLCLLLVGRWLVNVMIGRVGRPRRNE